MFVKEGSKAGTWVVKSKENDPRKDKIIVKSDGVTTYTAKDIAYHLWKFGLLKDFDFLYELWPEKFDGHEVWVTSLKGKRSEQFGHAESIVNVIGSEQDYPQAVVKDSLAELGFGEQAKNYHHLSYAHVALSLRTARKLGIDVGEEKRFYRMSGREGIVVNVSDLVKLLVQAIKEKEIEKKGLGKIGKVATPLEVATGAIRYYLTKVNYQTMVVFDFKQALSLEGDTGPYLQYAHARSVGILEKGKDYKFDLLSVEIPEKISTHERRLLKQLLVYPETLESAVKSLDVTILTLYANELASIFNEFYEKHPVLQAAPATRESRLALVQSFKQVMANALNILGIVAPDKM